MRGATPAALPCHIVIYISIHAPHAGRDVRRGAPCHDVHISIHAPHAGRDLRIWLFLMCQKYFNPRAPCGARQIASSPPASTKVFQSTRPMRGATIRVYAFYKVTAVFQSTRPMRGATKTANAMLAKGKISIHAPHAGRDETARRAGRNRKYFNPRAPCGARRFQFFQCHPKGLFQSTRPMRGATRNATSAQLKTSLFQSTRPMRGATRAEERGQVQAEISIHAPHAGRDH